MADADTLAYHYALIKEVLASGRMVFEPRAVDGAVPLLVQMTYAVAMALGGETAANLWLAVTGWGLAVLTAAVALRWLPAAWAMAVGVLVLTLQVVIYNAGTGQLEVRLAMFAMVAAVASMDAGPAFSRSSLLASAIATGLFAGAKLTGLFFGLAMVIYLLIQAVRCRQWRGCVLFCLTAGCVALPYYIWIWLHTGDPMFPFLFGWVPYDAGVPWNAKAQSFLLFKIAQAELAVPKTPLWFLLYPFAATFGDYGAFDSFRAGFGPWPIMVLPLALFGLWVHRGEAGTKELTALVGIATLFYALWFFFGGSQRVRHLLPVLPFALIGLTGLAVRCAFLIRPLAVAMAVTLVMQSAAQVVITHNPLVRVINGESHEAFIERNVGFGALLAWISANTTPNDRILHQLRQINYLLDRPYLFAMPSFDARVQTRPDQLDLPLFWAELRRESITYVVVPAMSEPGAGLSASIDTNLPEMLPRLADAGCAYEAARLPALAPPQSRSVAVLDRPKITFAIFRLTPGKGCSLDRR